jgi:hypothetical protein
MYAFSTSIRYQQKCRLYLDVSSFKDAIRNAKILDTSEVHTAINILILFWFVAACSITRDYQRPGDYLTASILRGGSIQLLPYLTVPKRFSRQHGLKSIYGLM